MIESVSRCMTTLVNKKLMKNRYFKSLQITLCILLGPSTANNDSEYKLRSDFITAEAYSNYVRKNIDKGMRVRCCESVKSINVFGGQTGIVASINHELQVNIKVIFNF